MTKPEANASVVKTDSIDNNDTSSGDSSSVSSNEKPIKPTQSDAVPEPIKPTQSDAVPQPIKLTKSDAVPQPSDETSVPTPNKPDLNPKPVPEEEVDNKPDINSKP